jgi:hypothetical protein
VQNPDKPSKDFRFSVPYAVTSPVPTAHARRHPSRSGLHDKSDDSIKQKNYTADSVSEFQQFEIGSVWTLKMNALGEVMSVER